MRKREQIGALMVLSRFLGIIRSFLQMQFLGLTGLGDAFIIAFRVPSFLRRIFSDGALSSAFVPTFVSLDKEGKTSQAESLMSYSFLFIGGGIIFLVALVLFNPDWVLMFAPGLDSQQYEYATSFVRILFPFILFTSSSALLAGAIYARNKFMSVALAPALFSSVYIAGLLFCLTTKAHPFVLAWWILGGGGVYLLLHIFAYRGTGFKFGALTKVAFKEFGFMVRRFVASVAGVGVFEFNMTIDALQVASLAKGSVGIIHYAARYTGIPVGIIGSAFSTVLLPRLSRTRLVAPSRFSFYLLEALKYLFWVAVPATLTLMFISPMIFKTFLSGKATADQMTLASEILRIYAGGLFFFCANRVLMSMLYALDDALTPTFTAMLATIVNLGGNYCAVGASCLHSVAYATTFSQAFLFVVILTLLALRHNIYFYFWRFLSFIPLSLFHTSIISFFFLFIHKSIESLLKIVFGAESFLAEFFIHSFGYWLWVLPLIYLTFKLLHKSRRLVLRRLYFVV